MKIRGLSKRYGKVKALNNVTVDLPDGEITGIIGRNGSGKTTLLETIMGLVEPDSGHIEYAGGVARKDLRSTLGVILQQGAYYDQIKVKEILRLFSTYYKKTADVSSLVALLDLQPYLNEYVNKLSGGTQQRVNLALAFINMPTLAVLDEPTTGLDPISREYFWRALRQLAPGSTVLLSTHSMEEIERFCSNLVVLDEGRLIYHGPVEGFVTAQNASTLSEAYVRMAGGELHAA
ncbi:ABC transporter ATP-binding protein [Microbacterium aurugineum]